MFEKKCNFPEDWGRNHNESAIGEGRFEDSHDSLRKMGVFA